MGQGGLNRQSDEGAGRPKLEYEMRHINHKVEETIKSFGKVKPGLNTGLESLDEAILGLQPQNLILIGGRPSMGKTSIMLDMALGVGKKHNVLVVSLEMGFKELQERALCSVARLNCHRIKSGFYDLDIQTQLEEAAKELKKKKVTVVDGSWKFYNDWLDKKTNPKNSLKPLIERAVQEYNTKCVFIDHLQFLRTEGYKLDSESLRLHEVTQTLHELTVELNIPIVLMSQLRRLNQERKIKDPTPSMDDIRNSGQVEEDCNVICILHRPEYYRSKQEIDLFSNRVERGVELIIEKNRNGPTGKINLDFHAYAMSFTDCEKPNDFLED